MSWNIHDDVYWTEKQKTEFESKEVEPQPDDRLLSPEEIRVAYNKWQCRGKLYLKVTWKQWLAKTQLLKCQERERTTLREIYGVDKKTLLRNWRAWNKEQERLEWAAT